MGEIRTFIAGILSAPLKEYILGIQRELKKLGLDAKWVEPQNVHLTLKFLGGIPPALIEGIKGALKSTFEGRERTPASLNKIGSFPTIKRPRVIWVGLRDEGRILEGHFLTLEKELQSLGFPQEKRGFRPHITLGRLRSQKNIHKFIDFLEGFTLETNPGSIERIVLFKSLLHPTGPEYLSLYEINLKTI